jgi:hypothetical protein
MFIFLVNCIVDLFYFEAASVKILEEMMFLVQIPIPCMQINGLYYLWH